MRHDSLGVLAGLAVFVVGLVALLVVMANSEPSSQQDAAATISVVETGPISMPPPNLEGVDAAIQQVLYSRGNADLATLDQLADLPPEVARILVEYGVTLTVPDSPVVAGK